MSIRNSVLRQASQIRHYRDFPSWWSVLQAAIGILFLLFLAYQFIADDEETGEPLSYSVGSDDSQGVSGAGIQPSPGASSPSDGTSPSGGTSSGTDVPAAEGTVSLEMQDGTGAMPVPAEALQVGEAAAKAVFTTDFTNVPLAKGAEIPPLPLKFDSPQTSEPVVAVLEQNLIVFAFAVDPDGPNGPEGLRQINVTVANDEGRWGYTGG